MYQHEQNMVDYHFGTSAFLIYDAMTTAVTSGGALVALVIIGSEPA
jgi:hypothetical protein